MGWLSSLFGGGKEESTPTMDNSMQDWLKLLPQLMQAQQTYAPQEAKLQYDLFNQYAPQYAQSQADIYKSIYPETYGLQEMLAGQASEGTSGELTDSERRQFLDMQKSLVGEQSTSGIGTDYIGSNLLNYVQNRKTQNQSLGLSLLNKIPTTSLTSPSYSNLFGSGSSSLLNTSMQYPFNFVNDNSGGLGGMLSGGLAGAAIGTAINPGLGTIIGAGIGGLGGGFNG